jgi:hypothetical protein
MAGERINRWLMLGFVMTIGGFVLVGWLMTVINNRYVSGVCSGLWFVIVVWVFYPREWRPRRGRREVRPLN